VIESVSSKLAITIIKQRVVVSFIKGTSTPTGLITPVIINDSYKKIYICIVVAQDFQVSNSGSWEPLVVEHIGTPL
jgi:hypothetical protein